MFLKAETRKEGKSGSAGFRRDFTMVVIGHEGNALKRFEPGDSMDELEKRIRSHL